jgi:hypothetical protein
MAWGRMLRLFGGPLIPRRRAYCSTLSKDLESASDGRRREPGNGRTSGVGVDAQLAQPGS